jgi:alkylation response protein AidB-like acyl-CoA dehydrogenase
VNFGFTEEQDMLRKTVRDFAEAEIRPRMMEYDESQEFPWEVIRKCGELGLMGVLFPEELQGAAMGYVEYVIIVEELSRVDGSVGISVAAHNSLCTNHLFQCGSDEQRKKYVSKLASGEWLGAWSLTEPTAGSDAAGTRTTARRDGDFWVLNGAKTFTTHGSVSDLTVVLAVNSPDKWNKGISAFVFEKGTPGFRPG